MHAKTWSFLTQYGEFANKEQFVLEHEINHNMHTQHSMHILEHLLTFLKGWNGGIVLELVERAFKQVLRVDLLHTEQVKDHIVREVERTV